MAAAAKVHWRPLHELESVSVVNLRTWFRHVPLKISPPHHPNEATQLAYVPNALATTDDLRSRPVRVTPDPTQELEIDLFVATFRHVRSRSVAIDQTSLHNTPQTK